MKARYTTEYVARLIDATPDQLEGATYVQEQSGNWYWNFSGRWQEHVVTPGQSGQLHAKAVRIGKGLVVFKKKPSAPK